MFRRFPQVALIVFAFPALTFADQTTYQIGMSKSVFRDVPADLAKFAGQPFQDLMKDQIGLNGKIVQEGDPLVMAKAIDEGKLHFGVFPGHEFAWAQEKYPQLQAIVCSVYRPAKIQAVILVRHDSKASEVADLKGSKLAVASTVRDHARLFWARKVGDSDQASFCTPEKVSTVHDGIHKVLASEADVTIADYADWSYFQKLYPGPAKGLKILAESEEFPATVLVFKKGSISEEVLAQVRKGFLTAHDNPKAARMMKLLRLERFSEVPEQFTDTLQTCRKLYPKPLEEK